MEHGKWLSLRNVAIYTLFCTNWCSGKPVYSHGSRVILVHSLLGWINGIFGGSAYDFVDFVG